MARGCAWAWLDTAGHGELGAVELGRVPPCRGLEAGELALRGEGDAALGAVPPHGHRQGLGDLEAGWHRQGRWQALGRVRAARACGRSGTAERPCSGAAGGLGDARGSPGEREGRAVGSRRAGP
jgi:hypothetical protein